MGKKLEAFALKYTDFIIRFKWLVVLASFLIAFAAASGAKNLGFATNYRVFFSKANPELTAFEEFQNVYTKNDNVLFVLQPKNNKVFSPNIADVVERVTEKAWQMPYSIRVDSVSNFQHTWANEDDLTVEDLVDNGKVLSQANLNKKEAIALAEPLLYNNLISPDAQTTGINVVLQLPQKSPFEVPKATAFAREMADEIRSEFPDMKVALTGMAIMNNAFAETAQKDLMTLVPLMYLILLIIMVISLRSFSGTIATVFVVGLSAVTAMGIAGYMGIQLTPISMTAPTIILTLAIADSIHILVTMFNEMRHGKLKSDALKESIRINLQPVFYHEY